MRLGTMTPGGTLRMRIGNSWMSEMCTPETLAESQREERYEMEKISPG